VLDTFISTYDGTSKVREFNKSIYVHQCELVMTLPDKDVKEMYVRFIGIINNLKSLEKVYKNKKMVKRCKDHDFKPIPSAVPHEWLDSFARCFVLDLN